MAEFSKVLHQIESYSCREFTHPKIDSCLLSSVHFLLNSCIGTAGFYAVLYLCQYASMHMKKKKKVLLKEYLKRYLRSTAFGTLLSSGTFILHCVFRRLLGRYNYYSVIFAPACIAGSAIFLESRPGQEICFNAFANCALELWLTLLERSKILKWDANLQTILFMAFSSLVSSLLSYTDYDLNYFWFFMPPKVGENDRLERVCFHGGKCWRHILDLFVKYSMTGYVLQVLRAVAKNIKNPKLFLYLLTRPRAFKLAAFLGGYATFYQTIRCYLYQKNKRYSLIHDTVAGLLAGTAFRFQPTIPIFNSAVITMIQIMTEAGLRRKMLPNIPYLEMLFMLFCGVLFHSAIVSTEICPRLMIYITSAATHGMSNVVANNYKTVVKNLNLTNPS